jgi:DNA-binding Lrp family transcriptional regulator
MSGIRSVGRVGSTIVPNWRWEDPELDSYQLRIAGWLASNTEGYCAEYVTRNVIAKRTGISAGKVSSSIEALIAQGIIQVETIEVPQSQGGHRWVITVDLDVWHQPRSPHDQGPVTTRPGPGHQVTATTGSSSVEEQGVTPQSPPTVEVEVVPEWEVFFNHFWDAYPRKVGKPAARRAMKAKYADEQAPVIAQGTNAWIDYWRDAGTAEQYIPHPSTFLNQDRHLDTPPRIDPAKKETAEAIIERIRNRDS